MSVEKKAVFDDTMVTNGDLKALAKSFSEDLKELSKSFKEDLNSLAKSTKDDLIRLEDRLEARLEKSIGAQIMRSEEALKIWAKAEMQWVKLCLIASGIVIPILVTILLNKYLG